MNIKLAEALLRRKELEAKVKQLAAIKDRDLFEVKGKRVKVTEDIDDLVLTVPLLNAKQVTAEYDFYSRQLRLCDAAIQQMNWTVEMGDASGYMQDYQPQPMQREAAKAKPAAT
jgi:hypothetical protein